MTEQSEINDKFTTTTSNENKKETQIMVLQNNLRINKQRFIDEYGSFLTKEQLDELKKL